MKALIVEDKKRIRQGLIHLLAYINSDISIVGECGSVQDAVAVIKACKPELVFLDINLSDGTGFDVLAQTGDLSFKVIFITAYEEYALQALKAGAVDYLLKPVDINELKNALNKVIELPIETQKQQIADAQKAFNNDSTTLVLSFKDAFQVIDLNELMYCESDKGYTSFFLSDGKKHLASKPLKEFEDQLDLPHFTRPHQSFIVNLKFVDRYDKSGTIHLKNGVKIPVSTRKRDGFISRLFNWNKA